MNIRKSFIAASMTTIMCLSINPVFAVDASTDDHRTNINYYVEESYKWSAPADITFTTNIDSENKTGTVSVLENIIPGGKTLVISIGPDEDFKLTSVEGINRDYEVIKESETLSASSRVLLVPSGTNEDSQELTFTLQGVVGGNVSQKAGRYTGVLNFQASLVDSSSISGTVPSVDMSNINTTYAQGDFSTKGNLVTVNSQQFRVLDVNGTNAKLLAMGSYKDSAFNSSSSPVSFEGVSVQQYAGSLLDREMTNYYNSLPDGVKQAIIDENINQSIYSYQGTVDQITEGAIVEYYADFSDSPADSQKIGLLRKGEISVGARKVYDLDVDDLVSYFGGGWNCKELNQMLFNTSESASRYVGLRSGNYDNGIYTMYADGDLGSVSYGYYGTPDEVRPVFTLDLSLVE